MISGNGLGPPHEVIPMEDIRAIEENSISTILENPAYRDTNTGNLNAKGVAAMANYMIALTPITDAPTKAQKEQIEADLLTLVQVGTTSNRETEEGRQRAARAVITEA